MEKITEWKRKCPNPNCEKELFYTRKWNRDDAEKWNINCRSCSMTERFLSEEYRKNISESLKGIKRSEETRKKISESKKGKKIKPFTDERKKNVSESKKGISRSEETKIKISESLKGRTLTDEHRKNIGESKKGIKRSEEVRKNMRLSALKRNGITFPNHNPVACGIINDYNKKHGFNFQHAENGGEVCIDGYWPDGLDEKRKTIIEIDEKHHFDNSGKLKQKDILRQRYLEGLGYKFIRIKI